MRSNAQEKYKFSLNSRGKLGYSPDKFFLVVSQGKDVLLYTSDSKYETVSRRLEGHREEVTSIDLSPSGDFLISGSLDNKVILWDYKKGLSIKTIATSEDVLDVKFIDQWRFAYMTETSVTVYDINENRELFVRKDGKKPFRSLVATGDGKYLAVGGGEGIIYAYY